MNKKALIILLPTIAMCAGCANKAHTLSKYHVKSGSLNMESKALAKYDVSFSMDKLNELYPLYKAAVISKNMDEIRKYNRLVNAEAGALIDKYYVSEVRYNAHPNDETKAIYDGLFAKYNEYYLLDMDVCAEAEKTEDEEIIKLVVGPSLLPSNPERSVEIQEIFKDYYEKGEDLDNNKELSLEEKEKAGISMFMEYAPYCEEYATLYGYDHYLDYSYKNEYSRAYTPVESKEFTTLIRTNLAPKYKEYDFSSFSSENQEKIKTVRRDCFALKSLNLGKELDKYATYLGGDYLDVYKHAFKDGYVCFSNDDNSMSTAATYEMNNMSNGGMLYFSKEYQDVYSVIHEFGHYYSFAMNEKTMKKSYDLNETFSQGNEMMFASYLLNNSKSELLQGVARKGIDSLYSSLLQISYAVDVENYLFENYATKSVDEIYEGISKLYDEYGVSKLREDYWIYPVMVCTGYYISYATSIEQSLQILALANSDFSTAYASYMNLINQDVLGEVEAWERAGLASPFKESTVLEIAKYFD